MNQTFKFVFGAMACWYGLTAQAQQGSRITGMVVDGTGEPVIGATVMQEGTSNGVVTDIDGKFVINVPAGSKLTISYIGFKTTSTSAADNMKVVLHDDSKQLNEVVVTGYTVQRKADLTGAISVVSVDDLAKQNENNPMKALQGRVPGMNISADGSPSGAATVRIRSVGTLNNNDPLYIIDGVPTKAGMHELNAADIESIQVLKDAASASIYGSRAANGVIIITTKKGKNGKVKVDVDASVAASMYAHKMDVLNAKQYGQVMWQAYVNDGLDPNTNGLGYHYNWGYNTAGYPVLNSISMSKYLDAAGTTPAADTDWFDETTRTGVIQNYNVAVSNGSERGSSYFSLGYYKNLGIIKTSDFERFSARMNTEYDVIKNVLTLGEHFTLNRTSEVQAPGGFLENVLQFNPSLPVYTTDGSYAGPVGGYPDRENPVARLHRNADNRYTYWRAFGDAYVNLHLFKGFNLRSTFGLDYAQKQQRFFTYPSLKAMWQLPLMPWKQNRNIGLNGCGMRWRPITLPRISTVLMPWPVWSSTERMISISQAIKKATSFSILTTCGPVPAWVLPKLTVVAKAIPWYRILVRPTIPMLTNTWPPPQCAMTVQAVSARTTAMQCSPASLLDGASARRSL